MIPIELPEIPPLLPTRLVPGRRGPFDRERRAGIGIIAFVGLVSGLMPSLIGVLYFVWLLHRSRAGAPAHLTPAVHSGWMMEFEQRVRIRRFGRDRPPVRSTMGT